ncbi:MULTISPECIES: addiction module antidote protein [Pseudomonas]|jgi:probable addiction module antidote protein|uniref:addiction module antidote protein n=1 Tax=Pseudomonas TaxID=286 RepID=UPI001476379C|nr:MULTISPECIES: addiction module antidote protein [Pseudomonas]MCQ9182862.1 putative addiction module antidote protein [Streptomyces hayashii]MEA3172491.1 hypothetical protein [Pseudomonas sp.]NMX42137.1 putative addiction module antidote protein [Pseudomonas veronii]NUU36651.1 putative addiction module antidote protein [Pseudomonas sp. C2B4]
MKEPIYEYDPAELLTDAESIAIFMADAFESGDASFIAQALSVVARAKGMTAIAKEAGVTRAHLYQLKNGNPTLKTMIGVMRAVGLDMTAKQHSEAAHG